MGLDFQSSSPPKKDASSIYTPSSGQKRFNPFMKGKANDDEQCFIDVEPTKQNIINHQIKSNTSPLTPTKDHPLMDLTSVNVMKKEEFMDESDVDVDYDEGHVSKKDDAVVVVDELDNFVVDNKFTSNVGSQSNDIKLDKNENSLCNDDLQIHTISPEIENQQVQHEVQQKHQQKYEDVEDIKNNNNNAVNTIISEHDPEKGVNIKTISSNNNNVNLKHNNRSSTKDHSQTKMDEVTTKLTKSTEKVDGKFLMCC
jgi:hypothetical protein